jgi:hypothetical protein
MSFPNEKQLEQLSKTLQNENIFYIQPSMTPAVDSPPKTSKGNLSTKVHEDA